MTLQAAPRGRPPGLQPGLDGPFHLVAELDHLLASLVHRADVAEARLGLDRHHGGGRFLGAEQARRHGVAVAGHVHRDPDEVADVEELAEALHANRAVALLQLGEGLRIYRS